MFYPPDPHSVYIIHKQKEKELLREIELYRIAREQRAWSANGSTGRERAWYAQAAQWVKGRLSARASVGLSAASQTETCPVAPC